MLHNITKRSPRTTNSLNTPAAAAVRGVAMIEDPANPGNAKLADGSKPYAGFQTRDSVVGGPALGDVIYPGRLELPFATGQEGTYEYAEEYTAEGAQFVDAGITGATAMSTPLSFINGKIAVATTGLLVEFILVELPAPEVAGNVKVRARAVAGYFHA
jgi:hypothetical protein